MDSKFSHHCPNSSPWFPWLLDTYELPWFWGEGCCDGGGLKGLLDQHLELTYPSRIVDNIPVEVHNSFHSGSTCLGVVNSGIIL